MSPADPSQNKGGTNKTTDSLTRTLQRTAQRVRVQKASHRCGRAKNRGTRIKDSQVPRFQVSERSARPAILQSRSQRFAARIGDPPPPDTRHCGNLKTTLSAAATTSAKTKGSLKWQATSALAIFTATALSMPRSTPCAKARGRPPRSLRQDSRACTHR